jgi:tryptophan-rich sensory protein
VGEALISIILIWLCVLLLAVISYTKKPLISMLLWPYLLWLSFASYLNFYIWYYN